MNRSPTDPPARRGFSLVEVLVALGLCSFVLVALLGLVLAGLRQDRDSQDTMGAMLAANRIMEGYRAVGATKNKVPNFPLPSDLTTASANDPSSPLYIDNRGSLTGDAARAAFGLVYKLLPSSPTPVTSSRVYLYLYWPASAPATSARGHYEVVGTISLTSSGTN